MDITNDIISFIFTEKQLSLPGLGLLSLSEASAYRSPAKTRIYGPKFTIDLKDNKEYDKSINKKFYQYVANKHNTSIKKAEDEIHKYSIKILNNLANYNSAEIENLGYFKRENDKIQFEFSPVFKDLLRESYPDYPLLLIDRKSEVNDVKTSGKPSEKIPITHRPNKTPKPGWIFPLIVLTLLSLGFVCLMYCLSGILPGDNSKSNVTNASVANTHVVVSEQKSVISTEDSAKVANKKAPDNTNKAIPSVRDITNNAKNPEELDKITLEELIEKGPELKSGFNKSCIIIVGSFKRKSNSIRMKKRLVKDNFTPYVEKYGRFYRTGVIFDCNKKPLYAFLEELRHSIDKGSWVLKYK